MLNYGFINKFEENGKTYFDVIISDENFEQRFNSVACEDTGADKLSLATALYNAEVYRRQIDANRQLIMRIIDIMHEVANEKIRQGDMDLAKTAQINSIITTNLGPLGINIDTPDLTNILLNRIADTIEKIKATYSQIEVTDDVKNTTLYVISQISEVINGNA